MSLGDDFDEEIAISIRDEETDDCPTCSGTGQEYEGDMLIGDCPACEGSGILDT